MDEAFDDEVDHTITIDEYLNNVEAEELEADLVLGGDEGKECTYTLGYMKRQAVFSCLTCCPDGNAGVCTACSLSCHDGHEVVELWTKRNFRCDCGNSRLGEHFCKLFPMKDIENVENSYNHNFSGLYCTCSRPYPDPDVEEQEEMIQCIICEDWFHEQHLGVEAPNKIPVDADGETLYEDFICKTCSITCSFLNSYPRAIWATSCQSDRVGSPTSPSNDERTSGHAPGKLQCVLGGVHADASPHDSQGKPMFLAHGWRDKLCRCESCFNLYRSRHVSYLLEKDDSIDEYERMAKRKRVKNLEQLEGAEMNFLNHLGHVEKVEILKGISDFKEEFNSFLESFDASKTITVADVNGIFENLAKRRRAQ